MEDPEYPRVLSPLTKGPITQFILEGKQVKSPDIPDVRYEPPHGKTNNVVSEQVRHKSACTSTEKS